MTHPLEPTQDRPRSRLVAGFLVAALAIGAAFRVWLLGEQSEDVSDLAAGDLLRLFVVGMRLDGMVAAALALPIALAAIAVPASCLRGLRRGARVYAAVVLTALALAEVAGVHFFRYYGFRPNYLVLEHGDDPEVLRAVAAAYPVLAVIVIGLLAGAAAWLVDELVVRALRPLARGDAGGVVRRWALPVLTLPALFVGGRGGIDHRPLNPSAAAIGSNRVANEIAGNGVMNVTYEARQRAESDYVPLASVARLLPDDEALRRARARLGRQGRFSDDAANPLVRIVETPARERPINVVVVVMESFTARLVGHLGGELPLTPELDKLAAEGVVLANCYATGERTVQGLEAAVSSFPPLPGVSAVRRPESAQGFATLASVLGDQRGYDTFFLYGGQGVFDHMVGFFRGNGYRAFIEERDFADPAFKGSWGASDEDVFARAVSECRARWEAKRPFLCTVLTVSLHSPWEYPKDRITPLPPETAVPAGFEREELNNFLYADWAVGRFVRDARKEPWFDDTLFVFVGDHGVHLRGRAVVPSEEYRVASLLFAPRHVPPRRIERVTSQLDLAPTVLGILGGVWRTPFFGEDALRPADDEGFAVMVYGKRRYAVRRGRRLAVIAEDGPLAFDVVPGRSLTASPTTDADREAAADGLALLQCAETLLRERRYGVDAFPESR